MNKLNIIALLMIIPLISGCNTKDEEKDITTDRFYAMNVIYNKDKNDEIR